MFLGCCNRQHCIKFKAKDIWFLFSAKDFVYRKLFIGVCPQCKKDVAELTEVRRIDGKIFSKNYTDKKFSKLIAEEKNNIDYKISDFNKKSKKNLYGFIFGINTISSSKKSKFNKQFSADFFGNKKLIKKNKV